MAEKWSFLKKRDANHWGKGDHSGARFDLCTVYGHIHQHFLVFLFSCLGIGRSYAVQAPRRGNVLGQSN